MAPTPTPLVVGIAGGSASGKTSVVREVVDRLRPMRSAVLRHDAYYHDLSHLPLVERRKVNVDHPDSLETALLIDHLDELTSGRPIDMPVYDFASQTRVGSTKVEPAPLLVVEGILVLADERLREVVDFGVYVDVPESERLTRRIARDVRERGKSEREIREQHHAVVQPMHDRFVEPSRGHADLIVRGGAQNRADLDRIVEQIRGLLAGGRPS